MSVPWLDVDDESGQLVVNRPRWVVRRLYRWAGKAQDRRLQAEEAERRARPERIWPPVTYDLADGAVIDMEDLITTLDPADVPLLGGDEDEPRPFEGFRPPPGPSWRR